MKLQGIYKIQSFIKPERFYIGSALDINVRWRNHINSLRKGRHHSKKLQNHFNKYGESDLLFSIIEPCLPEFLTVIEDSYIHPLPYFNNCPTAGSQLGMKCSEETKLKIGIANKGRVVSEETKLKMSKIKKGKKASIGTKIKMSKNNKGMLGMQHSIETKQKMSKDRKGRVSGNKGKIASYESREKMSKSQKGRHHSIETRKKMSEVHKGNKYALKNIF